MPAQAALAWYGGVGTTVALGQFVVNFLDDFVGVQDSVKSLQLKVKDDLNLIDHFMRFLNDLPAGTLSDLDESVLIDLANHLQPLMIRCETDVKKVQAATAGKTSTETYASRLAIRTIETLEKDLENWVQRLNTRYTLMSTKLKADAARAVRGQDATIRFQEAMQALASELTLLHECGRVPVYENLWLPDFQSVDFGEQPRKRRMDGHLADSRVLVEFVSYSAATSTELAQNAIGELAFILNRSDPSLFHVLRCKHIYKQQNANRSSQQYGLVFEMPSGLESMRSLSDVITDVNNVRERNSSNTLSQNLDPAAQTLRKISSRVKLAYQLAMAVRYLHSFGYVHQSIRTSNILVATFATDSVVEAYLGGFERSRPNAVASNQKRIDADWRNNIYRSPDRVATTDDEVIRRHTMSHDIYSLGVVLLELGLFKPLISREPLFRSQTNQAVRENLIFLAKSELPQVMDDTYTGIVGFCLNSTPGSWVGSHVAEMQFVEQVIDPLSDLLQSRR